jgi:hypothetical protein
MSDSAEKGSQGRDRILQIAQAAVLVGCIGFFCLRALHFERTAHGGFMIDDAYISLRHAENLVNGHGLNFNADERVEGYTNFLWTLLMAVPFLLGLPAVPFIKIAGVVAAAILMASVWSLVRRSCGSLAAMLIALALALDDRLAIMSTWGLEITFYPMLLGLSLLALFSGRVRLAAVLFAATCMTRMEGIILVPVVMLTLFSGADDLSEARSDSPRAMAPRSRRALTFLSVFLALFGSYFVLRWIYYSYPLPNTFYVKVGTPWDAAARGVSYVRSMLGRMGILYPAIASVPITAVLFVRHLVIARRAGRSPLELDAPSRERAALVGCGWVYLAFIIMVGGDVWAERFIYHALPVVLIAILVPFGIAAAAVAGRLRTTKARARAAISGATAAVLLAGLSANAEPYFNGDGISGWASLGIFLKGNSPKSAVIATCAAGALPYFSEMKAIDLLGLTDVHIAHQKVASLGQGTAGHEKQDPRYVLDRKPEFISTWVGRRGAMGRGFDEFFEYYRWYSLIGILDMGKRGLDTSRVHVVAPGASRDEIASLIKNDYAWGVAQRQASPQDAVVLPREKFASQLVDPLPATSDSIVGIKGPHRRAVVLFSLPFKFAPGEYSWKLRVALANGPREEGLCVLDAMKVQHDREEILDHVEIGSRALDSEADFEARFRVAETERDLTFLMRVLCEGKADVEIRSVIAVRRGE